MSKIAQIAEHKVELSSINAIVEGTMKANSEYDKFNDLYGKLIEEAKQSIQSGEKYLELTTKLSAELEKFDKAARAIGINPNEYKEIQNAKDLIEGKGKPAVIASMIDDARKII